MVSFCWEMNFPHNKKKKKKKKNQFRFIDDVLEINDQSRCILFGPPCIGWVIGKASKHFIQEKMY